MRFAALALLVTVTPAAAQAPVPDTTAPWRYHPMGASDVWEYAYWSDPWGAPSYLDHYQRLQVAGDTLVSDTLYTVMLASRFALDGTLVETRRHTVRFDSANAVFAERHSFPGQSPWPWAGPSDTWACRLDSAFPADPQVSIQDLCFAWSMSVPPTWGLVDGGYGQLVYVGPQPVLATLKRFRAFIGVDIWLEYAAGIGLLYSAANEFGGYRRELGYARIAGVEYGSPLVAEEPRSAEREAFSVSVTPNPSPGPLRVRLTTPSAELIVVEAFDALGRRVHTSSTALAAGSRSLSVDASQWAAGAYVVRATAGGVSVSETVVRR